MANRSKPPGRRSGEAAPSSRLFVSRPVLAIVLNLLIVVAGVAAFCGVEIRELPNIDRPVITIRTNYDGATPETIDKEITGVIEGAVARTPGVVSISLAEQRRPEPRHHRVRSVDRPQRRRQRPPRRDRHAPRPSRRRRSADHRQGRHQLRRDHAAVGDLADACRSSELTAARQRPHRRPPRRGRRRRRRRSSSATASRWSASSSIPTRWPPATSPSTTSLAALVERHARRAGRAESPTSTRRCSSAPTRAPSRPRRSAPSRSTRRPGSATSPTSSSVRPTQTTSLRMNGKTGVGLGIIRQAKSNALDISAGVRDGGRRAQRLAARGVKLTITSDDAIFIRGSIQEVIFTLLLATAIVIAIIYLFLRSVRVTFIPAVTVPIALIGTLRRDLGRRLLDQHPDAARAGARHRPRRRRRHRRHREHLAPARRSASGRAPPRCSAPGRSSSPCCRRPRRSAAVFIPISFFPGVAGRLFSEFGFVLAFAVMLSAFVALTLCPMLASRWIGAEEHRPSRNPIGRAVTGIGRRRRAPLRAPPRRLPRARRWSSIVAALLFAGGAVVAFRFFPPS